MKFLLSVLSALALLRSVTLAAILIDGEDPTIPTISNDFTCQTEEVDKDGNTVLEQLLVWSASARRSLMSARGSLVHGYMEQIKRCDLIPDSGWFSNAAGTSGLGSTWSCTNTSIPVKSELPTNCQYGSFWEINSKESPQYSPESKKLRKITWLAATPIMAVSSATRIPSSSRRSSASARVIARAPG